MLESKKPRLFAMSMDGSATKVQWKSEFSGNRLAPCDLYERAMEIETADHLPISFKKDEDGTFIAAIYQKAAEPAELENVIYMIFDLSQDQKNCLEEFSIFVRQSRSLVKTMRMRSFHCISKVRIWRTFKQATGWESLNACEMDVLEVLRSLDKRLSV
jgi:hypothetical protein